jgi:hypothetical protein
MDLERAKRIVKAAAKCTNSVEARTRIESVGCFIREDEAGIKIVAVGNWNNVYKFDNDTELFHLVDTTPSRLAHLLERLGIELDWADENLTCLTCGRVVRCRFDCVGESVIRHSSNTTCTSGKHRGELPQDRSLVVKVFKVVSVSGNRNSFGLKGMILIAPDGETWEVAASEINCKTQGECVRVPVVGRIRTFAALGFEIPKRLPDAPADVVAAVWK